MRVNPRRTAHFSILDGTEGMIFLPRVLPLIELELSDKNERVGHDEGKLIIPDFRVCSHLTRDPMGGGPMGPRVVFRR